MKVVGGVNHEVKDRVISKEGTFEEVLSSKNQRMEVKQRWEHGRVEGGKSTALSPPVNPEDGKLEQVHEAGGLSGCGEEGGEKREESSS